jgi:hypothetical protein
VTFATYVSDLSQGEIEALQDLADKAKFRELLGRGYTTSADITDFWEPCARAFFIRLPAGGSVHRHTDEVVKGVTHHFVLATNPGCENWWLDGDVERVCHLEQGKRYAVERAPIHWSFNRGETDRVHLLVEY